MTIYRRGDYDEALRIRREVELPSYERLGDTHAAAITWGKIADIAYYRGGLRRGPAHPPRGRTARLRAARRYPRGRHHLGQSPTSLQRGELDEALRIRREEELPVYERLGDVARAPSPGARSPTSPAGRGELDEALRIRREEAAPRLRAARRCALAAVTWGKIADIA